MTMEWFVILLVLLIGAGAIMASRLSLNNARKLSVSSKSTAPALDWIHQCPPKKQATQYHHAITFLWKHYERPLAAALIQSFLEEHPSTPVAHFWVQKLLSVEPAIGQRMLSSEFLEQRFKPELAACCGPTG